MSDLLITSVIPLVCPQGICTNGIYMRAAQLLTFVDPRCLSAASCAAGMTVEGGGYE
ncbi:MAG: hypothetical protein ACRBCT_03960 [Alphaproteobacteria bacterium]